MTGNSTLSNGKFTLLPLYGTTGNGAGYPNAGKAVS
jgi:hypothetical protein